MNKLVVGGIVAGGLMLGAAGLVIGAGLAHADTYGARGDHSGYALARELEADGWIATSEQTRDMAITVCEQRAAGNSTDTVIDHWETNFAHKGVPTSHDQIVLAVDITLGGEWHFCPEYGAPAPSSSVPSQGGSEV